jgi:tetratricopeptide (TPR) repeat protein
MPSIDDILAGVQDTRVLLQDFVPLSECLDWKLGHVYWHQAGAKAFISDRVPTRVISDGNLSAGAAEVFFTAMLAAETRGDLDGEIRVLEVGAGSGLFARYFLDEFLAICRDYKKDYYGRLCYLVTDNSQRMLDDIASHRVLGDHNGHYRLELSDAGAAGLGLQSSGPYHWIFFNYVLDTLPASILRIDGEDLCQLEIRTSLSRGIASLDAGLPPFEEAQRKVAAGDYEGLGELYPYLSLNHRFEPINPETVPYLRELLESTPQGKRLVVHNYRAVACLEQAVSLLHPFGCIQVADYNPPEYDDALDLPYRTEHYGGSIAIGLNFNLLERAARGGDIHWIEPDGGNGMIEIRLLSRCPAETATSCFQRRFGSDAFAWRLEPAAKARKLASEGNPEAAIHWFREALKRQPRNWHLLWEAGTFLLDSLKDPAAALALASEALAINPIDPPIHLLRARCYLKQGLLTEAADAARKALELDPANVEALLVIVSALRMGARYAEALTMIAAALSLDGGGHCKDALVGEQQRILEAYASRSALRPGAGARFAGEKSH